MRASVAASSPTLLSRGDHGCGLACRAGQVNYTGQEADYFFVWGDEVQSRAVVRNLVTNAVKCGGGVPDPRIHVFGTGDDRSSRTSVVDNGPGVAPSEHEAISSCWFVDGMWPTAPSRGSESGWPPCRYMCRRSAQQGVRHAASGGAEFWSELPLPMLRQSSPRGKLLFAPGRYRLQPPPTPPDRTDTRSCPRR